MFDRIRIAREFANKINSDKISQIILFGSVARGDDTEDSDIDVLIVSQNTKEIQDHVDDEVVNVILESNQFVSAHLMSIEHFNKTKNNSFLRNVIKDGVIIG